MPNDRTPEQIAAGLSKAQRAALLWLPADGRSVRIGQFAPDQDTRTFLRAMGWMAAPTPSIRHATKEGQAVRAAVLAMQEARDGR